MNKFYFFTVFLLLTLTSCGSYFNQPFVQQKARIGETSVFSNRLKKLPQPKDPIVVGVYNFKDQTGQYKMVENGSSFSTAVTQGGTSVLVKALEDSKWFTPIERENLSNLLNERNIIRSTRQEYKNGGNPNQVQVPPLLYAGVLLEGGVVSYDSNIITGGMGARYFGVGGSTQYKQDRITVYLRAISTSSGKILKTVYVSKTILSQAVDASLFRYVNFQRLLEAETGFTKNEPVQLAVKEAVEKAVESLILEGIETNLWSPLNPEEASIAVEAYNKEKSEEELTQLYNRRYLDRNHKNAINVSLGANRLNGDYTKKGLSFMGRLGYTREITPHLGASVAGNFQEFYVGGFLNNTATSIDLNAEINILPHDRLGPYIYGGPGLIMEADNIDQVFNPTDTYFKVQYGAGLKYFVSERIDIRAFAEYNFTFTDKLDLLESGNQDDHYFNFGIGLDFHFGGSSRQKSNQENPETLQENNLETNAGQNQLNTPSGLGNNNINN